MEKKAKFFRNVIANVVLIAVLSVTIVYVTTFWGASVPTDEPVRQGSGDIAAVSIMIAVPPNATHVAEILEFFNNSQMGNQHVQVTFFVSGLWATRNLDLLKQMYASGHALGNYGFFNEDHRRLSASRIIEEIELTHKLVQGAVAVEMQWFLPPQGKFSNKTLEVARALNYTPVLGANTRIVEGQTAEAIAQSALQSLAPGNLWLLPAKAETLVALPNIVTAFNGTNFAIAPLDTLLNPVLSN